jgi:UDP-N-acetylmuramyl tripeptide synthase
LNKNSAPTATATVVTIIRRAYQPWIITAAIAAGVKPCIAKRAISAIEKIEGRGEVIHDKITVIIDYAHTKDAFNCILKTAALSRAVGSKLITVFGCGGEREKEKRPAMARLAEELSDFVIVTTDNSRCEPPANIIKDIVSGMTKPEKRKIISDRKTAIETAIELAEEKDVVLILGKGHEKYNIDKNGYHPFDERKIITEALNRRNKGHNNEDENNA